MGESEKRIALAWKLRGGIERARLDADGGKKTKGAEQPPDEGEEESDGPIIFFE